MLLSIALSFPAVAFAQTAPAPSASPPPPPAPAPSAPLPVLNAAPESAPTPPPPGAAPQAPPGYYVEGPPPGAPAGPPPAGGPTQPGAGQLVYEPPPPPLLVGEPPPPPEPRHVAPRTALWASVRLGWFFPFASAYATGVKDPVANVVYLTPVPWTQYVHSGPAFELDAGVRLARNYNIFALWQRAQFRAGSTNLYGGQSGGDSDYFAGGLRASSDADGLGVITELALGYRQARARSDDGSELQMTGGAFEGRIGVGIDWRINELFSVQPMVEAGAGSFSRIKRVLPGGGSYDLIGPYDLTATHGWFALSIGGSVDLFGAK